MDIQRPTRYPIHGRAQVALPDQTVVAGQTIDISLGGICLLLEDQVPTNLPCPLRFEMNSKGKILVITARTRSIYCVLASHGGYRSGFQFAEEDPQRTAMINSLAGRKPIGESSSKEAGPGAAHTSF